MTDLGLKQQQQAAGEPRLHLLRLKRQRPGIIEAPVAFEGRPLPVTMHNDQTLDGKAVGDAQMARQ